jgi:hypothetical protein
MQLGKIQDMKSSTSWPKKKYLEPQCDVIIAVVEIFFRFRSKSDGFSILVGDYRRNLNIVQPSVTRMQKDGILYFAIATSYRLSWPFVYLI